MKLLKYLTNKARSVATKRLQPFPAMWTHFVHENMQSTDKSKSQTRKATNLTS